jgi:transposase InsO family protein
MIPAFDGAVFRGSGRKRQGQVLHGSATATAAVRRAIQQSQVSLRALAKRYGINQKAAVKWKKRTSASDLPTGTKEPKSTVLSGGDEAVVVVFRRHTLLPLDDCLYALQPTIPHLTRSSLHRCLVRHGISRLPDIDGDKPEEKRFKVCPIGYVHIAIAEIQTAEGKLYLSVAIDRTSKLAVVQLATKTGRTSAAAFLEHVIKGISYRVYTVLTNNGMQFAFPSRYADGPTARYMMHMFDMRCRENGIEYRLTKVKHPWTKGQVERMNRTIKDATVSAITTTITRRSRTTSRASSTPIISAVGSRRSETSHPTSLSANAGQPSLNDSGWIQPIKCQD